MYPNPSYILVGDDLRFNCTLNPDNDHWNSSNIFFRFHNDPIEKQYFHIVDQYTAQLILPNATEHHSGRYYCLAKSNSHSNSTFICLSEAEVGSKSFFLLVLFPLNIVIKFMFIHFFNRRTTISFSGRT